MSENMFKKGLDRFNKTNLIEEEVIGSEKIIFEKGTRLVLCSHYKKDCTENNIDINETVSIYRVERSIEGYYDGIYQYHFTDKKRAMDFYKKEKMEMTVAKDKALNTRTENKDKAVDSCDTKTYSLKMNGMDSIEKAYVSISPSELDELSKTNHPFIRLAVANNTFTSEETLTELWKFSDYEMQLIILNHRNTAESLLKQVIEANVHIDKVLIAKANLIRREIVMDFSRVFSIK